MKNFTKAKICLLPLFLLSGISSSYAQYTGVRDGFSFKFDCEWEVTRSITLVSEYTTGWDGEQKALDNCSIIVYLDSVRHKHEWDYNDDVFNSLWHHILDDYPHQLDINFISHTAGLVSPDLEGSDEKFIEHHNGFKIAILGESESDDCSRDTAKYINVVSAGQQEPTLEEGAECHIMVKLDPTSRSETNPKEVSPYDVHKDRWFFSDREFQGFIRQINDFQLNIPIYYKRDNIDRQFKYSVGDVGPAGGWVFHVTDGGMHGLESAPEDAGSAEWGCYRINVNGGNGANGLEIGTGKENTAAIIGECGSEDGGDIAAQVASDYTLNEHTDWFLPSLDELNLMFDNLKTKGLGNFSGARYWSSSESRSGNLVLAWIQSFRGGFQQERDKSNQLRVRAIRSF